MFLYVLGMAFIAALIASGYLRVESKFENENVTIFLFLLFYPVIILCSIIRSILEGDDEDGD